MSAQALGEDLDRLYALLAELEKTVGAKRLLRDCDGKMQWPKSGVYFFFQEGENRKNQPDTPRVVRVGTHALTEKSQTTLWTRLKQHKGANSGGGNHRGSVFRLHVGTALIEKQGCHATYPLWGKGSSAAKEITTAEYPMECQVSEFIGQMPVLCLGVDTPEMRSSIERNVIGLLSNQDAPWDTPSPSWLGNFSTRPAIRHSGLWNVNHTSESYEPGFLDDLEALIKRANPPSA